MNGRHRFAKKYRKLEIIIYPIVYMSNNRKYNNLLKHYDVTSMKFYLETGDIPFTMYDNDKKSNLFEKQMKDFELRDGNVVLKSTGQIVVEPSQIETKIKLIYNDYGLGSGFDNLYEKVSRRYLGITRKNVTDFLKRDFLE